jgi:CubicO group peptidase (beta-lactamase class C family)
MRRMSLSSLSAGTFAVLSIVAASTARRAPADPIDEVIEAAMAADDLPSVAIVVGRAGTILKQAAYGEASLELHVPATTQTVYPIASATKAITSTAIFLLVHEGRFSLEDSITELLPDLPPTWLEVTTRHLLTHTSGLPDIAVSSGREALIAASRGEALARVCAQPLVAAAGARWSYNQTNYMLLQMLVERYGERPFETFVRERLFEPLGLKATTFGDSDDVVPGRASMYESRDGALRPRQSRFPDFVRGAAGVNTSVEEWYRWADAWAHARLLPRAELELLWQPAELASGALVSLAPNTSYGCGVMVDTRASHRSVGHSGGGNAAFRYFIDEDLLIVMATNGKTEEDALVDRIAAATRKLQEK